MSVVGTGHAQVRLYGVLVGLVGFETQQTGQRIDDSHEQDRREEDGRDDAETGWAIIDSIDVSEPGGETPLAWAVDHRNRTMVDYLLRSGADPDLWGAGGRTPLFKNRSVPSRRDSLHLGPKYLAIVKPLYSTLLGRAAAVVRNRRDVLDAGDHVADLTGVDPLDLSAAAGDECAEVERVEMLVGEGVRHVCGDDALGCCR